MKFEQRRVSRARRGRWCGSPSVLLPHPGPRLLCSCTSEAAAAPDVGLIRIHRKYPLSNTSRQNGGICLEGRAGVLPTQTRAPRVKATFHFIHKNKSRWKASVEEEGGVRGGLVGLGHFTEEGGGGSDARILSGSGVAVWYRAVSSSSPEPPDTAADRRITTATRTLRPRGRGGEGLHGRRL